MKYLVAIHRRDDYDPSVEDQAMSREIDDLNDEMVAAGIRVFVGGLQSPTTAKSIQTQPDGQTSVSEGQYLKSGEHVGGFWVLECASQAEAEEWGKKASAACKAPVEVRPFH